MKDKYTIEIIISYDSLCDSLNLTITDYDLISLKADIKPSVELLCYENNIKGTVFVEINITKNGKYFDSDTIEMDVN